MNSKGHKQEEHLHASASGCSCACAHSHTATAGNKTFLYIRLAAAFALLVGGMLLVWQDARLFGNEVVRIAWYLVAYLLVALPVMHEAWESFRHRDFFNEFTLMLLASIGALAIGEYPEGVAVMLFYSIGEMLQERAVRKAKENIGQLLDVRPSRVRVCRAEGTEEVAPHEVAVGETIEVSPGGRIPLDGTLENEFAWFDTASLTGESVPRKIVRGSQVLAGMIVTDRAIRIRVTSVFEQSTFARVLALVEEASKRKAASELFIRRMARVYTPVVFLLALLTFLLPWIYAQMNPSWAFDGRQWLYNSLMFLVISCPCALVISIPLSYFTAIGAASRRGILFKGGNVLDAIAQVNAVVFDKTGTLTEGVFTIRRLSPAAGITDEQLLHVMAQLEQASSHPVAKAVVAYARAAGLSLASAVAVKEIPGRGLRGKIGEELYLAGNFRLLEENAVRGLPPLAERLEGTIVALACNGIYQGVAVLSDALRPDAASAIARLRTLGMEKIQVLSGDKQEIVRTFAAQVGITEAFGDLLPEDKLRHIEELKHSPKVHAAFVGDGMNDAPALALSDVGLAMGGLGSDAAIESADVVLQTDSLSRIADAIRMGRRTRRVVWENVVLALGTKLLVLLLGFCGVATLWEAVFADVGVALLAVLNTMKLRIHHEN